MLVPGILAAFYWGRIAEDQYVSEARFLLRLNEAEAVDRIGRLSGLPSIEMARDTQVIADYLHSAALVSNLTEGHGLRQAVSGPWPDLAAPETWIASDWPARLPTDASTEDLVEHWRAITDIELELPAGILVFELRAFTPEEAEALARASISAARALVLEMNARVWADATGKAEDLFAQAADSLAAIQAELAEARNAAGILDLETANSEIATLSGALSAELVGLEQDYAAKAQHLAPSSAQMRALRQRIETTRAQLGDLEREAVAPPSARAGESLADVMARFAEIEVERDFAERQFLAAAEKLEQVRQASQAQMLYLDVFVEPTRPEEASYPNRAGSIAAVCVVALLVWISGIGLFTSIRNHIA
ncbi:MAG: hypothetical protein ACFBSD_10270 [Paracoccaceae bacterium]